MRTALPIFAGLYLLFGQMRPIPSTVPKDRLHQVTVAVQPCSTTLTSELLMRIPLQL